MWTGDTGHLIPCFDSCQFLTTQHECAISGYTWAPKLARKCEMDGRAVGVWSRDYQIFLDG